MHNLAESTNIISRALLYRETNNALVKDIYVGGGDEVPRTMVYSSRQ